MLLGRCRALNLPFSSLLPKSGCVSWKLCLGTQCEMLALFSHWFGLSISETGLLIRFYLPGWLRLIEICEVLTCCSDEHGRNQRQQECWYLWKAFKNKSANYQEIFKNNPPFYNWKTLRVIIEGISKILLQFLGNPSAFTLIWWQNR